MTHPCGKDMVKRLTRQTETPKVNNVVGGGPYFKFSCYTGCNRRNGPDFGRVFLMLNYIEKPQNTYILS
jgi:hypothetical protein